jgi:hypothetical protein
MSDDVTLLLERFLFSDDTTFEVVVEEGSSLFFELDELLFADDFFVPPTYQILGTKVLGDFRDINVLLRFLAQFEFSPYARAAQAKSRLLQCTTEFQKISIGS